jgi:hypothetical protein
LTDPLTLSEVNTGGVVSAWAAAATGMAASPAVKIIEAQTGMIQLRSLVATLNICQSSKSFRCFEY